MKTVLYNQNQDEGFVLPYILVVIFIMSLVGAIAFDRIQSSYRLVSEMQDLQNSELAILNAEQQVIYGFLTNSVVAKGLNLNTLKPVDLLREVDDTSEDTIDLWPALKGLRHIPTIHGAVIVQYQDSQGLVPLNLGELDLVENFLTSFGIGNDKSQNMAATLKDYIDSNVEQTFRGGERQTYRLHNMEQPTNSPLRTYTELSSVLNWPDAIESMDMKRFVRETTLDPKSRSIVKAFTDPSLLKILRLEGIGRTDFRNRNQVDTPFFGLIPSNRARFTFFFASSKGKTTEYIIEIERSPNDVFKPYIIHGVADFKIENGENDQLFDDIQNLKICCLNQN